MEDLNRSKNCLNWAEQQRICRMYNVCSGGSMLFTSSIAAYGVFANTGPYAVNKAALVSLTKILSSDLAPTIRVNALAPGVITTKLADTVCCLQFAAQLSPSHLTRDYLCTPLRYIAPDSGARQWPVQALLFEFSFHFDNPLHFYIFLLNF